MIIFYYVFLNIVLFYFEKGYTMPNSEILHTFFFLYLEDIFNTWNSKTRQMSSKLLFTEYYGGKQDTVSTLAFNRYLYNFPLSTCLGRIILHSE